MNGDRWPGFDMDLMLEAGTFVEARCRCPVFAWFIEANKVGRRCKTCNAPYRKLPRMNATLQKNIDEFHAWQKANAGIPIELIETPRRIQVLTFRAIEIVKRVFGSDVVLENQEKGMVA